MTNIVGATATKTWHMPVRIVTDLAQRMAIPSPGRGLREDRRLNSIAKAGKLVRNVSFQNDMDMLRLKLARHEANVICSDRKLHAPASCKPHFTKTTNKSCTWRPNSVEHTAGLRGPVLADLLAGIPSSKANDLAEAPSDTRGHGYIWDNLGISLIL